MTEREIYQVSPSAGGNFRDRVVARDLTCVMTGTPQHFTACHTPGVFSISLESFRVLIPGQVRHQSRQLQGRGPEPTPRGHRRYTRNGILLATQLHGPFGAAEVAFLSQLFDPIVFHVVESIHRPQFLR